jgi:protein-disulfide isomerase
MYFSRFFAVLLTTSSIAFTPHLAQAATPAADNTPVTRAQIPALVKEAILNDPSILTEAIDKIQAQQEEESEKNVKEALVKHKNEIFSDPNTPSIGDPATTDVNLVEFFDYHCGYCKQELENIIKLSQEDKKVRIIFKEYPILSDDSILAARAALAVNRLAKDKYFDFHRAMFAVGGTITDKIIAAEAKKLGIDPEKLKTEMTNPEIDATLTKNRDLGTALGVRGTPAIIIEDKFFAGAVPYDYLQNVIKEVRNANKDKKESGKAASPAKP